jgi:hypothetical protein
MRTNRNALRCRREDEEISVARHRAAAVLAPVSLQIAASWQQPHPAGLAYINQLVDVSQGVLLHRRRQHRVTRRQP